MFDILSKLNIFRRNSSPLFANVKLSGNSFLLRFFQWIERFGEKCLTYSDDIVLLLSGR